MKLLIVDDNEDTLYMISRYLQLSGHQCDISSSGKEGLELIIKNKYDVVLLDISMPDFSGYDVVHSLHNNKLLSKQKIVLFTASSVSDDTVHELISVGSHSSLKKPIDPDILTAYIENLEN